METAVMRPKKGDLVKFSTGIWDSSSGFLYRDPERTIPIGAIQNGAIVMFLDRLPAKKSHGDAFSLRGVNKVICGELIGWVSGWIEPVQAADYGG